MVDVDSTTGIPEVEFAGAAAIVPTSAVQTLEELLMLKMFRSLPRGPGAHPKEGISPLWVTGRVPVYGEQSVPPCSSISHALSEGWLPCTGCDAGSGFVRARTNVEVDAGSSGFTLQSNFCCPGIWKHGSLTALPTVHRHASPRKGADMELVQQDPR